MSYSVVQFAEEILEMRQRIDEQDAELRYLREVDDKYQELLGSSLAHSQNMVDQTIRLLMTPGVVEACQTSAKATGAA